MTPEQTRELLPVITAFSEGRKVQWAHMQENPEWVDGDDVTFSPMYLWRIKPDPHKNRVDWFYKVIDLVNELQNRSAMDGEYKRARVDLEQLLRNHPDTPKEGP
jgi:hypothetical protein